MLSDIERKVLRVIGNYSAGRRRTPTIDELCIKTGRTRGGIMEILDILTKEEYIEWQRSEPDNMEVFETWERKGTVIMAKKIDNLFGSSRFVLPEQRELYLQMKEDDKLVPMPILEQDEFETFDYLLRDAQQNEKAVSITWWRHKKNELGTICTMWGAVPEINANTRKVKLLTVEDVQWIPMDTIIDVRS